MFGHQHTALFTSISVAEPLLHCSCLVANAIFFPVNEVFWKSWIFFTSDEICRLRKWELFYRWNSIKGPGSFLLCRAVEELRCISYPSIFYYTVIFFSPSILIKFAFFFFCFNALLFYVYLTVRIFNFQWYFLSELLTTILLLGIEETHLTLKINVFVLAK